MASIAPSDGVCQCMQQQQEEVDGVLAHYNLLLDYKACKCNIQYLLKSHSGYFTAYGFCMVIYLILVAIANRNWWLVV